MSSSEKPPEPASSLKRKRLSAEAQTAADKLDNIFKRIKRAVPRAPYILATPSLDPYKYHSAQEAHSWILGHLFNADEEHLQYRTFLFREPYQDCFTQSHGEDDEPEPERPKSQASNATNQAPKKKMSLSAYKSKQANGVITPGSKKASPNLPPTKPLAPVPTNGVKAPEKQPAIIPKVPTSLPKRPATEGIAPEKPQKRTKEDVPAPAQKQTESIEPNINVDRSGPSNATPHGLPPLLSPVDQPLTNPYGLPALLSPTLPSNIQVELDRLESQRKRAESNASTSSSDRKSQLLSVPEPRSQKPEEGSKSASRVRSSSVNEKSPSSTSLNRSDNSVPSLVVKLKYSKRQGNTISKLLRLPAKRSAPTEKKEHQESRKDQQVKAQPKVIDGLADKSKDHPKITTRRPDNPTVTAKTTATGTKVAGKRPRMDDEASLAVPTKRHKTQNSQDGPTTPAQQMITSPALSNKSSAQKSQGPYATPRKDHKAINMLRTSSTEGNDTTPGRSGVTPTGAKHLDVKSAPTSAPINAKNQAEIALFSHVSMKLNMKGRSLKHEAQEILTEKGMKITKEDEKRVAVTSIECVLSYMAAYHAQDIVSHLRGRLGEVEGTWKTLLPLCLSYTGLTKDIPHLEGLRSYLSATISAAICTHVAPRATRPTAHDSPHDLPHAELAKQHLFVTENFNLFSDHYTKLLRYTQDARMTLPIEDVQKQYPKTWSSRENNSKVRDQEKINGANLSGSYFLPIQIDITPIQTVRFALRFLEEYCQKERLKYALRINLEKPAD
ncbi:hypothetical protein BDV95DRAFT_478690 [Massariosphaeria phaeospora]|uniref:Uncharacterized protein n=1 Tax=Massariosphaeria phaeospora TaxID=100035 RepID=A0A7C8MLF9_9PLEO|nr:hypothetical protein BDV95DRAFT_478690 [Massariosphaeria phaeospora]